MPINFNSWQNTEAPLGLAYIAGVLLKASHSVRFIDYEVENFSSDSLGKIIRDFKPDLVGISFRTASFRSAKTVCSLIRACDSGIKIMVGGPHVTAFPAESLKDLPADIAVRGEGELTVLELVDALKRGASLKGIEGLTFFENKELVHNQSRPWIENLDSLPFPPREIMPMDKYMVNSIITSRGCPFDCIYCDKVISSRKIKFRSAQNTFAEIEFVEKNYKKKFVYFIDDHFMLNRKRIYAIFDMIKKGNLNNFQWICQSRVDGVDEDILNQARQVGCKEIMYGIETGDEEELKFINKKTTIEQARKAITLTHKAQISIRGNFMIGFPVSTHKSVKNTIRFADSLPIDIYRFFIVSPLPNTRLWNYLMQGKEEKLDFSWHDVHFYSPTLTSKELSKEDIHTYIGVAYYYILKSRVLRELISLKTLVNFFRILGSILKKRRLRGHSVAIYFPFTETLLLEFWMLVRGKPLGAKFRYLQKVFKKAKGLKDYAGSSQ